MSSFWSGTVHQLLTTPRDTILGTLAAAQIRHFRMNETQQLRAWEATITLLQTALTPLPQAATWQILLEFPMLRLGRRPDAILLTDRAILVLEFKAGATAHTPADRRQVEDYAIDLHDFHAASRRHPILPILIAEHAPTHLALLPMLLAGATEVIDANAHTLPTLLSRIATALPPPTEPLDHAEWLAAPYRPVPNIIDAACLLYARHNVADIRAARSDATNLRATTDAILSEIAQARAANERVILFITGIPGAGKTLCGLNTIFGTEDHTRGTYLTGNPTLVHVLREALTRDAIQFGAKRTDADRRMKSAIQRLPDFRNEYVTHPTDIPPEQIVVIDEAQRCWSAPHAIAKTRDKPIPLTASEPAHLLEAMSRHADFAAMVCLVGGGQEIHDGEGGLAEWGQALRQTPHPWRIRAAPDILTATDPRQTLGPLPNLHTVPSLHLDISIRQIRSVAAADWVNHVLSGNAHEAAALAQQDGAIPFHLTRSLPHLRTWLQTQARGHRRAGLLASSGAKRLRAEGLGTELPHMDPAAVAHWFLNHFPDIRASNALETVATEFSCQGLELDYAGLCWDTDLAREPNRNPLARPAIPRHHLANPQRRRSHHQPAQYLPRPPHPSTLRNRHLRPARQRRRPHPQTRHAKRHRRFPDHLRRPPSHARHLGRAITRTRIIVAVTARKQARSFLKKRTKKLLSALSRVSLVRRARLRQARDSGVKSFLLLFFKKEVLACFLFTTQAQAAPLKFTTWNLNWLTTRTPAQADLPPDVHPRTPDDITRLATYAKKLNADVIALQEIDGPQAAARLFNPADYTIATIAEPVTQQVGIAVRHPITLTRNPDVTALDVEPQAHHPLRDGLDVTLTLPGGQPLRILVLHLKTGCQTDTLATATRRQCTLLAQQIPPLAAWAAARQREGIPFLLMGDFNRDLDDPEALTAALEAAAPLTRVTEGRANPCWDGNPFIDHIFAGGPARAWLVPGSLRVQLFQETGDEWRSRLSDHCPVSIQLDPARK